jgi:hypothetical protein
VPRASDRQWSWQGPAPGPPHSSGRRRRQLPHPGPGLAGGFPLWPLVGQFLGTWRQVCADLRREAREAPVPREFLQAVLDQLAGTVEVASLAGQLRPQEGDLGTGERGMANKPVEAVLGLRASQPVHQQLVPFGKIAGSVAAGVIRVTIFPRPPGFWLGRLGASHLVERVQVAVRENGPQVGRNDRDIFGARWPSESR